LLTLKYREYVCSVAEENLAPFGSLQMTLFQQIKIGSGRRGHEAIRIMHRKWRAWCQLDKASVAYGVACREGVWRLSGVCPQGGHDTSFGSRPDQLQSAPLIRIQ
jgi:hypothetical protein